MSGKLSKPTDDQSLAMCVTIPEIMLIWGKSRKTVDMQIAKGRIKGRQSIAGNGWILSTNSVIALWGKPDQTLLRKLMGGNDG